MNSRRIIKFVFPGVFLLAAFVYFLPQYQRQLSSLAPTKESALAEISHISAQAPLSLITEPDDGMAPALNAIENAHKSIDLVTYELEDSTIEQALADAKNRGVAVRVLLDDSSHFGKKPNETAYAFLQNQNVPVEWAKDYFPITHQKTLVVDNAEALILTFNFAPQYYKSSRDFGVVDTEVKDVAAIETAFDSDWNGTQVPADNASDLVWSPNSAPTLLALIDSASTSLDVYNEEMADTRTTNALEQAAKRGVNVRVNMTYATQWKQALGELTAAGVNVRTYASTAPFYIHAKVIVADDAKAFVGSENFSAQSLDANRELGILISRSDIIFSIQKTFNNDWAGSRPYAYASTPSNSPQGAPAQDSATIVKLSSSGICHPPGDSGYAQTKNFTPYQALQDCLNAGGRLPKNYQKSPPI